MKQELRDKHCPILFGTVGPGDMLYVPTGWGAAHEVMMTEDLIGIRVGCCPPSQLGALRFVAGKAMPCGQTHPALHELFACVGAAGAMGNEPQDEGGLMHQELSEQRDEL